MTSVKRCEVCGENPADHHARYGPVEQWLCVKCWNEFCDKYNLTGLKSKDSDDTQEKRGAE